MSLAKTFYGRFHAENRRRVYNAWRGQEGVSSLRQRVLEVLGVDEDGNPMGKSYVCEMRTDIMARKIHLKNRECEASWSCMCIA